MDIQLEKNNAEKNYAGFGARLGAYLLDFVIMGIPLFFLSMFLFGMLMGSSSELSALMEDPAFLEGEISEQQALEIGSSFLLYLFLILLFNLFISVFYFAGLHASKWQATIGKKLLGLIVTDLQGNRISFWRSLGRYLAMSFLSGIFLIGFIMAAFTEKKQALHDLIAGTIVLKK